MKNRRLNLIFIIFFIAFFTLAARLFDLTIIQGETYRKFSDNNRIKQIDNDASRGIIYDRNGVELATNKPIYNINAYNDRFNEVNSDRKNEIMKDLVQILEEEGVNYLSDYAFDIYNFKYENQSDYFNSELSPSEKVIELIKDNNLLKDIFLSSYSIDDNITFYPLKRMKDYLILRGKDIPIEFTFEDGIDLAFKEDESYEKLISSGEINEGTKAINYVVDQVKDDSSFINYIINHPISRKIVYDLLVEKGLNDNIILSDLEYSFDLQYIEHKALLHKYSDKITENSNAKSDFINLVKDNTLQNILTGTFKRDDSIVIPASILISDLEKHGISTKLSYSIDDENNLKLEYTEGNENKERTPEESLMNLANENQNILDEFLIRDDIIFIAQDSLFNSGIYPRMYIKDWEYTYLKDKKDLFNNKEEKTARELFEQYKEKYKIENNNDYVVFGQMSIYNVIDNQGFYSYRPVTIAKDLSEEALTKIESIIPNDIGIEVVVQPSRYYPNGNLASHTLGYIGSISENSEIEEFVEYKKYDPNDSVGKTGLEQSFEDTLRGSKGRKLVYTDVYGNTTDVIEETNSTPGNNLYTTLDINLQKAMENIVSDMIDSLSNRTNYESYFGEIGLESAPNAKVAASVIMDVNTGEILAMTSYPSYDPNLFVNGISNHDWNLLNDSNEKDIYAPRPILNNLFQAFTPGSTFKTVTALAALENGLNPESTINNFGYIELGTTRYNDLIYTLTGGAWGPLNLYDALKVSSNYYFYVLGLGYNPNQAGDNDIKVSLDDIQSMTKRLGLQDPVDIEINIPHESSGLHPDIDGKKSLLKGLLRQELDGKLEKYLKEGVEKNQDEINSDLSTILSWIDIGPDMSRESVINSLDDLGYEPIEAIDNERSGLADNIKYSYLNMAVWTESDSVNMSIGQGQNAYTPLQMIKLTSIIANEGKIVKPTIVKEIKNYLNDKNIYENDPEFSDSGVEANYFKSVKEGMRRAATTVNNRAKLPIEIGSKTGTAQISSINPDTGQHRLAVSEIAFVPFEKPEIAVYSFILDGEKSYNASQMNNELIYAYYKYVKKDPRFTNDRNAKDASILSLESEQTIED